MSATPWWHDPDRLRPAVKRAVRAQLDRLGVQVPRAPRRMLPSRARRTAPPAVEGIRAADRRVEREMREQVHAICLALGAEQAAAPPTRRSPTATGSPSGRRPPR